MFIKARKAFNGTISHKCFHAWKLFRALTIVRRAFKQKLNYVARQHWLTRKKVRIFRSWNEWNRVVRGRYEVATNLLCNVRNELIARVSIRIWRAIARDVQRARSHHALMERESQQLDKLSATQLESKYTGDIFKVRDRPQDRVGYLPQVLQEKKDNLSSNRLDDELLGRLLRRRRICLRQINLHECSSLTCHGFRLLAACSNLQDINLSRCLGLTDDAVRLIVESCPLLLYLNLSHTLIFDQAIRHLAFQAKHLLYLSIAYCLNLSPECSTYFKQLTAFQMLIYLDLSGCEQIGPICLQDIFKSLPKVRHWILNSLPWMTDTELKMLGDSCQAVETVELLNCVPPKLIPASLSAGLRTAANSLKPELVKRSFTTPGVIGKQHMDRSRPGRITDTGLFGLCGRGLKRFLAAGLPYVDGSGFQSLNPNSDLPRRTSNTRLQRLAPVTSAPAAKSNERNALTQFTVTDCPRLSERTLNHLQQSPYLTVLNLSGNRQLGDAGVKIISDSAYVGCLRELYLTGCDRLTDRAVRMIDQRFSQLAYLSLASCPLLTDATLTVLAQLRRLWQLNLSETKLGDQGLAALGSITKLHELKVSECTGISDHGLQRFAKDGNACHSY
ncbi:putative adenylate kinase [Fasciola gigantica]|uniref:Putative adenylate kinase n=1 Tax=Fasciola gigantica TaxID=46835 RepID=A0A504YKM9_FASGI|nr:putative adenylate kinase [Fasciola gigantica]